MKPFKLTGFRRLYSQLDVTDKNPYQVHKDALAKLEKMGHKVSKMDDIEKQANIKPPKPKKEEKPTNPPPEKEETKEEVKEKKPEEPKESEEEVWEV